MLNREFPPQQGGWFRVALRGLRWLSVAVVGLGTKYFLVDPLLWTGFASRLHFSRVMIVGLVALLVAGGVVGFLVTWPAVSRPWLRWALGITFGGIAGVSAWLLVQIAYPGHVHFTEIGAALSIFVSVLLIAVMLGALFRRVMMAATVLVGWSRTRALLESLVAVGAMSLPPSSFENATTWIPILAIGYVVAFVALPVPAGPQ